MKERIGREGSKGVREANKQCRRLRDSRKVETYPECPSYCDLGPVWFGGGNLYDVFLDAPLLFLSYPQPLALSKLILILELEFCKPV